MKSVKLEWCLGKIADAKQLLEESVKHYSDFAKVSDLGYYPGVSGPVGVSHTHTLPAGNYSCCNFSVCACASIVRTCQPKDV